MLFLDKVASVVLEAVGRIVGAFDGVDEDNDDGILLALDPESSVGDGNCDGEVVAKTLSLPCTSSDSTSPPRKREFPKVPAETMKATISNEMIVHIVPFHRLRPFLECAEFFDLLDCEDR